MEAGLLKSDIKKGITVEKPTDDMLERMGVYSWPVFSWPIEENLSRLDWYYDSTVTCYILEGEAVVCIKDGEKIRCGAGDLVVLPRGLECTWDIRKAIRKHYYSH